jgi:hypothetical protein
MKKDAAIATVGILTFGHEAQPLIDILPLAEQDALYNEAAKAIADRLNTTLTSLVVHRDESAPHAHYTLAAYDLEGIPLSKKITPTVASELQDIAGSVYDVYGIHRGEKKKTKIARLVSEGYTKNEISAAVIHRTVKTLHEDLPKEIAKLEEKVAKNTRLIQEQTTKLEQGKVSEEQALKRIATYEHRRAEADKEIARLTAPLTPPKAPQPKKLIVQTGINKSLIGRITPILETRELVEAAEVARYTKAIKDHQAAIEYQASVKVTEAANRAAKRSAELDQREAELKAAEHIQSTREADRAFLMQSLSQWSTSAPYASQIELKAASIINEKPAQRYGVDVITAPAMVLIPPGQQVTDRQIAAALYRVAKETAQKESWYRMRFDVASPAIAALIADYALKDDIRIELVVRGSTYQPYWDEVNRDFISGRGEADDDSDSDECDTLRR